MSDFAHTLGLWSLDLKVAICSNFWSKYLAQSISLGDSEVSASAANPITALRPNPTMRAKRDKLKVKNSNTKVLAT